MLFKQPCPRCGGVVTKMEWLQFWARTSIAGGRVVRPCAYCGQFLRLSATAYLNGIAVTGLLLAEAGRLILGRSLVTTGAEILCVLGAILSGLMTHLETIPIENHNRALTP